MKIVSLDITNIRKIQAFNMELNGENLQIAGGVAEGKTTVINALWEILTKRSDTVSHGATKGRIKIKLSDGSKTIIAERITTKKSSVLSLIDQDGDNLSAADFKSMISDLSVNPHQITKLKGDEQVRVLLRAADIEIDLQAVNIEIAELEEERLTAHRSMSVLKPSETVPEEVEKVSLSELLAEIEKGEAVNSTNSDSREKLADLEIAHTNTVRQITQAEEQLKALKTQEKTLAERIEKGKAVCKDLEDVDVQGLREKVAGAEAINEKAAEYNAHTKAVDDYQDKKIEHDEVNDKIKALKEKKRLALENAKWPIEGLSVDDNKVYYNDCLLENLGESEQMLVCCALATKDIMANPMRVVRLDGIESISKEHFKILTEMFNKDGIQVLSTRVAREPKVESGEIKIVDGNYEHAKK